MCRGLSQDEGERIQLLAGNGNSGERVRFEKND